MPVEDVPELGAVLVGALVAGALVDGDGLGLATGVLLAVGCCGVVTPVLLCAGELLGAGAPTDARGVEVGAEALVDGVAGWELDDGFGADALPPGPEPAPFDDEVGAVD